MKFFVLYLPPRDAEALWHQVRRGLVDQGLPTTRRRLQAITIMLAGEEHVLTIGIPTPLDEDPLLMIFEAGTRDLFLLCTASHGVDEGEPIPLALSTIDHAWDFEPEWPRWQ
jgi:hypothetical protein